MSTHDSRADHQPARPEQESETPQAVSVETLREQLGVAIHTGLRKAADSGHARAAWRAIYNMNPREWQQVIEFAIRGLPKSALTARERDALDAKRLDWLDRMNAALNKHYGTNYGWKLVLSPNVVRLMRDGRASISGYLTDIDLNDTEGGRAKHPSCRDAIDEAMRSTGGSNP